MAMGIAITVGSALASVVSQGAYSSVDGIALSRDDALELSLLASFASTKKIFPGVVYSGVITTLTFTCTAVEKERLLSSFEKEMGVSFERDKKGFWVPKVSFGYVEHRFPKPLSCDSFLEKYSKTSLVAKSFNDLLGKGPIEKSDTIGGIRYRVRPWIDKKGAVCDMVQGSFNIYSGKVSRVQKFYYVTGEPN